MQGKRRYTGTTTDFEKKLDRVMERLGVTKYQDDWTQNKAGASCYVEMLYGGRTYRFENDTEKSKKCGRNITATADLLAEIVYSLEGLARAVEKGIFTLDMLLAGVPALPASKKMEACFLAMGFTERPASVEEVKKRYRELAKLRHPDGSGTEQGFIDLQTNYNKCMELMEETE